MSMEEFHNLEEIKAEFSIENEDVKEIRKDLIKLLAKVHPTNESGEFDSEQQKDRHFRISQAIDFIDKSSDKSQALVPISIIPELIKLTKDISILSNQPSNEHIPELSTKLEHRIEKSYENYKSKIIIPKISFTAISGILTLIWLFPTAFSDHPYFSNFINRYNSSFGAFSFFYFFILFFTLFIWIISLFREIRKKEFYSLMKSESFQNTLFSNFISNIIRYSEIRFSKSDLTKFIIRHYNGEQEDYHTNKFKESVLAYYFSSSDRIDKELAESVADLLIARGLENGLLKKERGRLLENTYKLIEDYGD
jgi:hypothetical protein